MAWFAWSAFASYVFPIALPDPSLVADLSTSNRTGLGPVCFGYLSQIKGFRYVNWVLFAVSSVRSLSRISPAAS